MLKQQLKQRKEMEKNYGKMSSSTYSNSPCAACKFLRRKCLPSCVFAPYFPSEESQKFANVHKIFGASNVSKLLNEVQPHQREDAVNSLAYEAEARMKDPVYGCVGAISILQRQVIKLQRELDATNANLIRYACSELPAPSSSSSQYARRSSSASHVGSSSTSSYGHYYSGLYFSGPCGDHHDKGEEHK